MESDAPQPRGQVGRQKNEHAVALGRLGGKKGGTARARALPSERRRDIAKKAAQARWGKSKTQ